MTNGQSEKESSVDDVVEFTEPAPGVALVRLNRPEKLNALSGELMSALEALWRRLARREDLRCTVLTGNGRGFCAGADSGYLGEERRPRGQGLEGELSFLPGHVLEHPVIVAVNGICAGGGLHFVADADFVIAARSSTYVDPHVSVGQVSGIEPPSLALRLPLGVIARMALLGVNERIPAQRLYDLGAVTELVDDDQLVPRAIELAGKIAAASPAAVRSTRRSWQRLSDTLLEPSMCEGWDDVQRHWAHPDSTEGPRAFEQKRTPRWAAADD